MNEIQAPFTDDQVTALNVFQAAAGSSGVRCDAPAHLDGALPDPAAPLLIATRSGWRCSDPRCDHRLYWAPADLLEIGTAR